MKNLTTATSITTLSFLLFIQLFFSSLTYSSSDFLVKIKGEKDGTYLLGNLIGEGNSGMIHALLTSQKEETDWIVKIFKKRQGCARDEKIVSMMMDASDLPFTKTHWDGQQDILIKKRIRGITMSEFLGQFNKKSDFDQSPNNSNTQLKKLEELLLKLMISGIYFQDIHCSNIMFDTKKNEWFIVDANIPHDNGKNFISKYTHPNNIIDLYEGFYLYEFDNCVGKSNLQNSFNQWIRKLATKAKDDLKSKDINLLINKVTSVKNNFFDYNIKAKKMLIKEKEKEKDCSNKINKNTTPISPKISTIQNEINLILKEFKP
ncbi:MAG: hypothetical protein HQK49_20445 [Oligoflexia bacterium]|nr:hypothetical protein [Oligoflexia bacterium]